MQVRPAVECDFPAIARIQQRCPETAQWPLGDYSGFPLLLALVDAALKRISQGTFGMCLNCGQEIGGKRLEAIPWTRYCITCQELIHPAG